MSHWPQSNTTIPAETVRIARAALPHGALAMQLRDALGTRYTDQDFADLFAAQGQVAVCPWQVALVTVLQCLEGLTDRQAADAVRSRLDWKDALGLALTDPGFAFSVRSGVRARLVAGAAEGRLLTVLLDLLRQRGLLHSTPAGGNARTRRTCWPLCAPSTGWNWWARHCASP